MQLADRISRLNPSPIREILNVIDTPGMISFAGGLPSSESFPDLSVQRLDHKQLQYGATEGELELRQQIADDLADRGLAASADQVLILSGSQQGIDLVAKLVINDATPVAVELPTYLAALQVFSLFGAKTISYTPENIDLLVEHSDVPALTYTIPTFQNPTGYCYSTTQRQALARACDLNGSILFEDDPYRALAYDECDRRPICSFMKGSNWIYQSSFSKTLAPGLRLGYMVCSAELYPVLCRLKQAADLHSNRLSQQLVLDQLRDPNSNDRTRALVAAYKKKRDHFALSLNRHLHNQASWEIPKGGLFFWLQLKTDKPVDTQDLLSKALKNNVAFMPGDPFFASAGHQSNCIRLNFRHASEAQAEEGLQRLSVLLTEVLD